MKASCKSWLIVLATLALGIADGWYLCSKYSEIKIAEAVAKNQQETDLWWKNELVARDFARYNSKTSQWEFLNLQDVCMSATILSQGVALEDIQYINYSLEKKHSRK